MDVSSSTATGRRLLLAAVALVAADLIGGLIAVSADLNTWGEVWGSEPNLSTPWPMFAGQLLLAWLAARNVRPALGRVAAVVLAVVCGISLIFGLFDGDLASVSGWPILWGIVLLVVTAIVGWLAIARARELRSS